MFLSSIGIILRKSDISPHKVVILDKVQGKIECVTAVTSLSVGALITYNIRQQQSLYFMSDSSLVYIPLSLAHTDMLFFHHVLELIYYFTYVGTGLSETFDLLAFLYSIDHTVMTVQFKKFFLLKLLTSMGSMPELDEIRTEFIAQLSTKHIKELSNITIDAIHEKELDKWLRCCVWQHPYGNEFKTVHFLAENRTL